MKNYGIIFSLFFILLIPVEGKTSTPQVDSLSQLLLNEKKDTSKVQILIQIYETFLKISPEKAGSYLEKALNLAEESNYEYGRMISSTTLGRYLVQYKNQPSKAFHHYTEGYKMAEIRNDLLYMGINMSGMAYIYRLQGQDEKALEYLTKAYKNFKSIHAEREIAKTCYSLGQVYENLGTDVEIIRIYQEGLEIALRLKDDYLTAMMYSAMGSFSISKGDNPEALDLCQKALVLFEKLNDHRNFAFVHFTLASIYLNSNQPQLALSYAKKGLEVCKEYKLAKEEIDAYGTLEQIYVETRNFEQAYFYRGEYNRLKEAALGQTQANEISNIQSAFIQEKKDAIAAEELEHQKFVKNGFIIGFGVVLCFAGIFFTQRNKIKKGKKLSDDLLLNILPKEVADELKETGAANAKQFNTVTVLFTDFVNFTGISQKMSAKELVAEIHKHFSTFDGIIEKHGLEKIKTIGDAYMAVCGLPNETNDHAQKVINAGLEFRDYISTSQSVFQIRIGIHSGPVVAGIVGVKKYAYDIWGDTVNIASRMESNSDPGKVNISGSTYALVKDDFAFESRGKIAVKGTGAIEMYFVEK